MLLFLAGITSSISLAQPAIAFLEDEFDFSKARASWVFGLVSFLLCQPAIFLLGKGAVDELDFWGGTVCLVLFATVESILFAWVFGMEKAWTELHVGSDITIPRIYRFIIKYITPAFLLVVLACWFWQDWIYVILMKNVSQENKPFVLCIRIGLIIFFALLAYLVWHSWQRREQKQNQKVNNAN